MTTPVRDEYRPPTPPARRPDGSLDLPDFTPPAAPGRPTPPAQRTVEERLKDDLSAYEREVAAHKGRIEELQRRIDGAKTSGMQWLIPAIQADLDKEREVLGRVEEARAKVQNQYWEKTGQYEKLLAGTERDAFMAVNALFKNYGLDSLAGKIFDFVKNGYSADTISILLQDTAEYKQRFVGNETRKKAGLPVLSPAEYLATEAAYRQVMESAGLPKGFYDSYSDFADFMGKNISPTEIQNRVDLAVQATTLAPPEYKEALKQMGIAEGDMVAYWLDEKKAMPLLTKAAAAAKIGAQALKQGLNFNVGYSQELAQRGISAEQAAQGYSAIAAELENLSTLGSIYGAQWNQRMAEQAMFEGDAGALNQKRNLAARERGAFGGSAGTGRGGLAQRGGQK